MRHFIFLFLFSCFLNSFSYAADPCLNIQQITCGQVVQFRSNGLGEFIYPNNLASFCSVGGSERGGQETIYSFIVPSSGTYQVNKLSGNNNYVDYYSKIKYNKINNPPCSNTGWFCFRGFRLDPGDEPLGAFNLNTGDTLMLLVNANSATTLVTQSFVITCAMVVCESIQSIACGDTAKFSAYGFGDPNFPNPLTTGLPRCVTRNSGQGGQETIYRFVVPATGAYQIINITSDIDYVGYYYKRNNTACSNTDWTCMASVVDPGTKLPPYNWNAGDTILILLNAESVTTPTNQSFKIVCSSAGTLLPLSLIDFQGIAKDKQVNLSWRTSQEQNTQNFIIERSSSQADFSPVGSISAANNSSTIKEYSFTDKEPLQGSAYYRLKMLDKDGKSTYSKVISVKLNKTTSFALYPNPVTSTATIMLQSQQSENIEVKVVSSDGKVLSTQKYNLVAGNNRISLDTKQLTTGIYAVFIAGKYTNEHMVFSKQ
jgi:hypothetical protein